VTSDKQAYLAWVLFLSRGFLLYKIIRAKFVSFFLFALLCACLPQAGANLSNPPRYLRQENEKYRPARRVTPQLSQRNQIVAHSHQHQARSLVISLAAHVRLFASGTA
jgi:hypothetical protein